METIVERVRRGAMLLDTEAPGWAARINEDELNLGSCDDCVLGQVCGHYTDGVFGLLGDSEQAAIDHGFQAIASGEADLSFLARYTKCEPEYAALAAAWLAEIRARLAPAPLAEVAEFACA